MADILLAVEFDIEAGLIEGIIAEGHTVVDRVAGSSGVIDACERLRPDVCVMSAAPDTLTRESLACCERAGVRPVGVVSHELDLKNARALGLLETVDANATWAEVEAALRGTASSHASWTLQGVASSNTSDSTAHSTPEERPAAAEPQPEGRRARRAREQGRGLRFGARGSKARAVEVEEPSPTPSAGGRVVPVWGPHGSPGRTTVAIALAAEAAQRGERVILIDADSYGGAVAPALGIVDEAPGFAAACRLAASSSLTPAELDRVAAHYGTGPGSFRVLTGIPNPSRWPELSRERVLATVKLCRELADLVVIDLGFSLESDDEIASDLMAPRRNASTFACLELASAVVAVTGADAVSLQRFLRARLDLRELVGTCPIEVVANGVRTGAQGFGQASQIEEVLTRFGGIERALLVPFDAVAADRAIAAQAPVTVASPRSGMAKALRQLPDRLGIPSSVGRSGRRSVALRS